MNIQVNTKIHCEHFWLLLIAIISITIFYNEIFYLWLFFLQKYELYLFNSGESLSYLE